jgi:glutamate synthase (NADPH/NADH) small chain
MTVISTDRPHVRVLVDRCVGCQECIIRCPTAALTLDLKPMVAVADDDLCVGCRQCERTCPFSAIVVSGPVLVAPRVELPARPPDHLSGDTTETRLGVATWAEAISEASRCLACPDPTCVRGCPAHNDIPAFISALAHDDIDGAHAVLRRTSVLPDICSRVCDQAIQCEGACTWSLAGQEPVAIGALERFVCDNAPVPPATHRSGSIADFRVAIIGSGPAGLAAAWELVEAGAHVTVYDKDAEAGGLLRWGIPDFTLPAIIVGRPVAALVAAGVEFCLGVEVRPDELDALAAANDAVIVAIGAGRPLHLPIPGADLDGVWDATRFLTEGREALANGTAVEALLPRPGGPATVLVFGAGNTAMDVARTARRLGAEATCVDWMDRRFAPVRPDELAEAEAEGVAIRFNTTVDAIEGFGGAVRCVHVLRTRQRHLADRPRVIRGDGEYLDVDLVVMAMGYQLDHGMSEATHDVPVRKSVPAFTDRRWLASGLLANPAPTFARQRPVGALALGRETARLAAGTERGQRIWVAGDALTGPATVVEAMAQGKEAALAVIFAARARNRPDRPVAAREIGTFDPMAPHVLGATIGTVVERKEPPD